MQSLLVVLAGTLSVVNDRALGVLRALRCLCLDDTVVVRAPLHEPVLYL